MAVVLDTVSELSAYRKVRCTATLTANIFDMKKAVAEVIINGSTAGVLIVDLVNTAPLTFVAKIDAQSLVQDFLGPNQNPTTTTSSFGVNGQPYKVVNSDLFCTVSFSVTYLEQLSNGKLQDFGLTETTGDYSVFTATTQNFESIDLAPFKPALGTTSRFLTNSPKALDICPSDSYYLSIFSGGGGFDTNYNIRVQTFDNSGTLIQEGLFEYLPLLAGTVQAPITLGVGPDNLRTATYDQGAVNIDDPNISYYEIVAGTQGLPTFIPSSETISFDLAPCCDSYKVRVYFMNNKGGFDAVTMQYTEHSINTKSTILQKPLNWADAAPYHNPLDKGKYPVNIEAQEVYKLEKTIKSKLEGDWLQELTYSPEIYIEIDGQTQGATIVTGGTVTDIKDDLALFEITLSPSNNIITMRN